MQDDPLWIDVSTLMQKGNDGVGEQITRLGKMPQLAEQTGEIFGRLNQILGIRDIDLHIEEVTGSDKTVEVVVGVAVGRNCPKETWHWPDLDGQKAESRCTARWKKSSYDQP